MYSPNQDTSRSRADEKSPIELSPKPPLASRAKSPAPAEHTFSSVYDILARRSGGKVIETTASSQHKRTSSADLSSLLDNGDVAINFATMKFLARGAQGRVYSVEVEGKDFKRLCVLKQIGKPASGSVSVHEHATRRLSSSSDEHILKLIKYVAHEGQTYVLLPHCPTVLTDEIASIREAKQTDALKHYALVLSVLSDIVSAAQYMHAEGIVHRDIKPDNIGHLAQGGYCLFDLDISKKIGDYSEGGFIGTLYFVHPACDENKALSTQPLTDIYALGMVLKILIDPTCPLGTTEDVDEVHFAHKCLERDAFLKATNQSKDACFTAETDDIHAGLVRLCERMLCLDETKQPAMQDIIDGIKTLKAKVIERGFDWHNFNQNESLRQAPLAEKKASDIARTREALNALAPPSHVSVPDPAQKDADDNSSSGASSVICWDDLGIGSSVALGPVGFFYRDNSSQTDESSQTDDSSCSAASDPLCDRPSLRSERMRRHSLG